jgi:hypothetical protein
MELFYCCPNSFRCIQALKAESEPQKTGKRNEDRPKGGSRGEHRANTRPPLRKFPSRADATPIAHHTYSTSLYQRSVTLCQPNDLSLLYHHYCYVPVATGARFARCYYEACVTHMVIASAHSSDGPSDINGLLLLSPTIASGSITSEDHCYCGARGTRRGANCVHTSMGRLTSADPCYYHHNSDRLYDIRVPLQLCGIWHAHGCY